MSKSKFWSRSLSIFTTLISVVFVLAATVLAIIFLQGYTIDFRKRELVKTGVLNIETRPRRADIWINDQNIGQTNKVYPNLPTGEYRISLKKNDFHDYNRTIPVLHGLASLIDIQLVYKEPKLAQTLAATTTASQFTVPLSSDRIIEVVPPSEETGKTVIINTYRFNKPLFNAPQLQKQTVVTFALPTRLELNPAKDIFVVPNDQGTLIVVGIADKTFLVDTNLSRQRLNWQTASTLQIPAITLPYRNSGGFPRLSWRYNEEVLLVETDAQIWSYHAGSQVRTILFDKPKGSSTLYSMSSTDLHIVSKASATDTYTLSSVPLTGGSVNYTEALSFLTEDEAPVSITANGTGTVLVLSTTKGSYLVGELFDGQTGLLINNSSQELTPEIPIHTLGDLRSLQFNTHRVNNVHFVDSKQFLSYSWQNSSSVHLERFVYNKEQPDQITHLGVNALYQSSDSIVTNDWIANANYLPVQEGSTFKLVDFTGNNAYQILQNYTSTPLLIPNQAYIITFEQATPTSTPQVRLTQIYE